MCREDVERMTAHQRARIMALCGRINIDQDERHELAEYLIGIEGGRLGSATMAKARRLIDGLEGYIAISQLMALRPPGLEPKAPKPAGVPVIAIDELGRKWTVAYK